jgi:hypothetical protein
MKFVTRMAFCAILPGLFVACGQRADNPVSPTTGGSTDTAAAPDGSTLKATTPAIVSPNGGAQITDPVLLTASKAAGKYADIAPSYQFQVRSGNALVYDSGVVGGIAAGGNVTHTVPSSALNPDTDYSWRVRASFQGAVVDVLAAKTLRAANECGAKVVTVSGGVSCNQALRTELADRCRAAGMSLLTAPPELCTDNAAMIAFAASMRLRAGQRSDVSEEIDPNLALV